MELCLKGAETHLLRFLYARNITNFIFGSSTTQQSGSNENYSPPVHESSSFYQGDDEDEESYENVTPIKKRKAKVLQEKNDDTLEGEESYDEIENVTLTKKKKIEAYQGNGKKDDDIHMSKDLKPTYRILTKDNAYVSRKAYKVTQDTAVQTQRGKYFACERCVACPDEKQNDNSYMLASEGGGNVDYGEDLKTIPSPEIPSEDPQPSTSQSTEQLLQMEHSLSSSSSPTDYLSSTATSSRPGAAFPFSTMAARREISSIETYSKLNSAMKDRAFVEFESFERFLHENDFNERDTAKCLYRALIELNPLRSAEETLHYYVPEKLFYRLKRANNFMTRSDLVEFKKETERQRKSFPQRCECATCAPKPLVKKKILSDATNYLRHNLEVNGVIITCARCKKEYKNFDQYRVHFNRRKCII